MMNGGSSLKTDLKDGDNKMLRKVTEALLACLRPSFQAVQSSSYNRLSQPVKGVAKHDAESEADHSEEELPQKEQYEERHEEMKPKEEEADTIASLTSAPSVFQEDDARGLLYDTSSDDLPFDITSSVEMVGFFQGTVETTVLGAKCPTPLEQRQIVSALRDPLAVPKPRRTVAFAFPDTIFRISSTSKRRFSPKLRSREFEPGWETEDEGDGKAQSEAFFQYAVQRKSKIQDLASFIYTGPVKSLDDLPKDILVELMARLRSMEDLLHLVRSSPICRRTFEERGGLIFNGIMGRDPSMHEETIQLIHLAAALRTGLIREYMPNLAAFEISLGRPIDMFDERGVKEIYSPSTMRPRRLHAFVFTAVRVQHVAKACLEYTGQFKRTRWELLTHSEMVLPKLLDKDILLSVWTPEQRALLSCWRMQVLREMYHAARTDKMGWTAAEHKRASKAEVTDYQLFFRGFKLRWWWIGNEAERNDAVRKELEMVVRCLLARMGFQTYVERIGERLIPLPPKKGKGWKMFEG